MSSALRNVWTPSSAVITAPVTVQAETSLWPTQSPETIQGSKTEESSPVLQKVFLTYVVII